MNTPNISDHIFQSKLIGRKGVDGCGRHIAVFSWQRQPIVDINISDRVIWWPFNRVIPVLWLGNCPSHILAKCWSLGFSLLPHENNLFLRPARHPYSHSASVGSLRPFHWQYCLASFQDTWTTGWFILSAMFESKPSGFFQLAPGTGNLEPIDNKRSKKNRDKFGPEACHTTKVPVPLIGWCFVWHFHSTNSRKRKNCQIFLLQSHNLWNRRIVWIDDCLLRVCPGRT